MQAHLLGSNHGQVLARKKPLEPEEDDPRESAATAAAVAGS